MWLGRVYLCVRVMLLGSYQELMIQFSGFLKLGHGVLRVPPVRFICSKHCSVNPHGWKDGVNDEVCSNFSALAS